MCENRFFICRRCGNVVGVINDSGVPIKCCGQNMEQLEPERSDEKSEKHKPIVKIEGNKVDVKVGNTAHPMEDEHSITWVYLQTDRGGHRKCLEKNGDPHVEFVISDEKPLAVYAYCNLHGMWITEV